MASPHVPKSINLLVKNQDEFMQKSVTPTCYYCGAGIHTVLT